MHEQNYSDDVFFCAQRSIRFHICHGVSSYPFFISRTNVLEHIPILHFHAVKLRLTLSRRLAADILRIY